MNHPFSVTQRTLKLALASAFAVAAATASINSTASNTATAAATASVIAPIAVTKATDLSFGKFAPGVGGSVTISTSGARTVTGVIPSTIGSTLSAAKFDVTGDASATYSITHSGSTVLTNTTGVGAETMTLAKFSDLTAGNAISGNVASGTLTGGAESIYVGGSLTVAANQVPGSYTGTVTVLVEYN